MPLYKKVLILGATSGIGEAMAVRLAQQGTSVILVGRRKERLEKIIEEHSSGSAKADMHAEQFDISDLSGISGFAQRMTSAHPDLDCVVINAGIQRGYDFTKPHTVDLDTINQEIVTNYTSYVYLTMAFLPHLQSIKAPAHLVYMSSGLALLPALIRSANYCASKAALHSFLLGLREQLKQSPGNQVKIVEVFPPAVQTELHSTFNQPDLVNGESLGMPLAEFTDKMFEGLQKQLDQIPIGTAAAAFAEDGFETKRQAAFNGAVGHLSEMLKNYTKG